MRILHRFTILLLAIAVLSPALGHARQESQIDSRGLDLFEKGQQAHQAGRLEEALALYDQALEADPELWSAHFQRGVAFLQLDRPADAEKALRRAIEIEDLFAAAHAALGESLLAQDRFGDAEKEFARALDMDPGLTIARWNLAVVLYRRDDLAGSERELTHLESDGQATLDSNTLHGEVLFRLDRPKEAIPFYDLALALDARSVAALVGRGRARAMTGDMEGAAKDLAAAYAIDPSPDLANELAELNAITGHPERSVEALRQAVEANPSDVIARRALIDALVAAGRADEAAREVEALVEASPNDPETLVLAGDLTIDRSPQDAAVSYVRAVRLKPDVVDYRVKLGTALLRANNAQDAREHFRYAVEHAPDNRDAHAGYAASLAATKSYPEAAREFAWLVAREPDSAIAHFGLGANLDRAGDCVRAKAAFERFLQLADPQIHGHEIQEVTLRVAQIERQIKEGTCKEKR